MTSASLRYRNPGAMWGGARANKWGAVGDVVLKDGQANHIAIFPTYVQGAAAQFDLWKSVYSNMTLADATKKWSGGNSDEAYVDYLCRRVGITRSTRITVEFLAGPKGLALMKAQAHWEAGQDYPMTDVEWRRAQDMVFKSAVGPAKPNVRTSRAVFDPVVEAAQNQLKSFGYFEVGDVDGLWGGRTIGALAAFLTDRKSELKVSAADGTVQQEVQTELTEASADGFSRPVSPVRANTTAADLAPKNVAVKQSLRQRLGAQVVGWVGASGALISGAAANFSTVNDTIAPVKEYFTDVPGWVWFAGLATAALIMFLSANHVKDATVADYNKGKIN